jgi:endonuclease/exonuclease/phosphatase family metal-dependent hydrolase
MKTKLVFLAAMLFFYLNLSGQNSVEIFYEAFTEDLGQMNAYSVSGEQQWVFEPQYGSPAPSAKVSGYNNGNFVNEDWLITPGIDLSGYSSAEFSFDEAINFDTEVSNHFKVLISTNYTGTGNPAEATWTELAAPQRASGDSWTFISSGIINLDTWVGESQVYIGFKYLSSENYAGTWEADNILLTGVSESSTVPQISEISTIPSGVITETRAVAVKAKVTDDTGISEVGLNWGYAPSDLNHSIVMSLSYGDTYQTVSTIPAQEEGTKVYYQISAVDTDGNQTKSTVGNYSVGVNYFDVVTYNIEWLGSPEMAGLSITRDEQITKAAQDILSAESDIYALQEIVVDPQNGDALTDLITKLNALDNTDTWGGAYNEYFSGWWNPDFEQFPAQRQAFVYKTSVSKNVSFHTLLSSEITQGDSRFAYGRLPYMMQADVSVNGKTEQVRLVNLHLKCCPGYSAERKTSMEALINELNTNYSDVNVIVLGDMNVADNGGAYGEISAWGIYDDNNSDGKADYTHAAGSVEDINYGDIDHILISDELNDEYSASSSELQNQILASTVSDHSPVKTSMVFEVQSTEDTEAPTAPANLTATNIAETSLTLSWDASADNVGVIAYDVYQDGSLIDNTINISYNVSALSAGQSYSFFVKARDEAGNESAAGNTLEVTTGSSSVFKPDEKESFKVFPSKTADGRISVVLPQSAGKSQLKIYSISGVVKKHIQLVSENTKINLESLPAGMYIVMWQGKSAVQSQKIIIE